MAEVIPVAVATDPRLGDYRHLRDASLRKHLEAENGLFLAEGEKVVRRAVEAGFKPRSFLMASRWLEPLADILDASVAPCYVVAETLTEQITGFHVHRGALASMERSEPTPIADVLARARTIIVLEDIVDHTNVGAIFRSSAALGVDAILLSPRCADPLYRRSIKVSMGAVFAMPYARMTQWYDGLDLVRTHGFSTIALTVSPDSEPIEQALRGIDKVALIMGSEGPGVSRRWLETADRRAVIPMSAGIDSLNVAAASAVACYLAGRR